MRLLWIIALGVLGWAVAQDLSGQYFAPTDVGGVTLTLQQDGAGNLSGSISGNGVSFSLSGQVAPQQPGAAFGLASGEGMQAPFELYTQGDELALYLFDYLPDGSLDIANATEIVLTRQSSQTPTATPAIPASPASPLTPKTSNPLLPPENTALPQNPLTPTTSDTPFTGRFQGEGLVLELAGQNPYTGYVHFQGQQYPVQARSEGMQLEGSFAANGSSFPFEASLQGSTLSFSTGDTRYHLVREIPVNNNPLAPANSLENQQTSQPSTPTNAAVSSPTSPQGQQISLGQRYAPGTVVSASTGLSITIPTGYQGAFDTSSDAFTLLADDQSHGFAIVAFSTAKATELGNYAVSELQTEDTQLSTTIPIQQTSNSISAGYRITSEQGQLALFVSAKDSSYGNAVVVGALSAVRSETDLQTLTNTLMEGIHLSAPDSSQAEQYRTALGGTYLTRIGSHSHYDAGIGAGDYASTAGQNQEHYSFCSDGSYSYDYESEFYFSSEAGSVSNTETDQHQGNWRLGMNIVGYPALVLNASDGRVFVHPLDQTAEGIAVGDGIFQASASNQCR